MKKTMLLMMFFTAICVANSYAQKLSDNKVPAPVKKSMTTKFPGVTKMAWSKEENDYESEFTKDGKTMSAIFDASGNWKETETAIAMTALPQPVKQYISQHMAGKKLKEAAMINKADGSIVYEVETAHTDYVIDANGKLLKTEKEGSNEQD